MMDNYQYVVLALIGLAIVGITYLVYKKKGIDGTLDLYRDVAFQLMLSAEKRFFYGEEKKDYVVECLYLMLPTKVTAFLTREDIKNWMQTLYDDFIMDYLDDGYLNKSYK